MNKKIISYQENMLFLDVPPLFSEDFKKIEGISDCLRSHTITPFGIQAPCGHVFDCFELYYAIYFENKTHCPSCDSKFPKTHYLSNDEFSTHTKIFKDNPNYTLSEYTAYDKINQHLYINAEMLPIKHFKNQIKYYEDPFRTMHLTDTFRPFLAEEQSNLIAPKIITNYLQNRHTYALDLTRFIEGLSESELSKIQSTFLSNSNSFLSDNSSELVLTDLPTSSNLAKQTTLSQPLSLNEKTELIYSYLYSIENKSLTQFLNTLAKNDRKQFYRKMWPISKPRSPSIKNQNDDQIQHAQRYIFFYGMNALYGSSYPHWSEASKHLLPNIKQAIIHYFFKDIKHNLRLSECDISLQETTDGVTLPCHHTFSNHSLKQYFNAVQNHQHRPNRFSRSFSCPLCKQDIPANIFQKKDTPVRGPKDNKKITF